jgi:phosphoribosyl 1,2-cyclic phosphodiesterase
MIVRVLGSGSRGNAIAVTSNGSTLLIDAGFGLRTLRRRAESANLDLSTIAGILLTHEHSDHARGAAAMAGHVDCPVYASPGTLRALHASLTDLQAVPLSPGATVRIGPLEVTARRTSHDAAEPLAVRVSDLRTGGQMGVAYDLGSPTAGVRDLLRSVSCLIVEANHDDELLRTGPYPRTVQHRIAGPSGHLSNRAAAAFVSDLWHDRLHTIVLAHVSQECNRADLAERAVREALAARGFRGMICVAKQGEPLEGIEVGAVQYSLDVFA